MTDKTIHRLPNSPRVLTINGGSSSIKFALFEASDPLRRILEGRIERIGLLDATLRSASFERSDNPTQRQLMTPRNHFTGSKLTDLVKSGWLC